MTSTQTQAGLLDRYADAFGRHRWFVAGLLLAITAVAACGYLGPEPDDSGGSRTRQRDANQKLLDEVSSDFERGAGVDCFVVVECDDVFTQSNVGAIRKLVGSLEDLDEIRTVIWIDKFPVFDKLGMPQPLLPPEDSEFPTFGDDFAWARKRALAHPLMVGQLVSEDGQILLMPVVFDSKSVGDRRLLIDRMNAIVADASAAGPLHAQLTGNWPLRYTERDIAEGEKTRFQIIGYGLLFVMAAILFRSFPAVLIVSAGPVLGVFWTLGILGLMNEERNSLADAILPILITMVGFTDGVHLMEHIRRARAAGDSPLEAAKSAIRRLGIPCFLTSFTTAVGFGSLMITDTEVIRGFGRACSVGVVVTFVAVVTVIPLLSSTRLGRRVHAGVERDLIGRALPHFEQIINATVRYAKHVTIAGVLITAILSAVALTLRPDNKLEQRLPTGSAPYQALAHCDKAFGGIQFISVHVDWPETASDESPKFLQAIADVEQVLADEPLVHYPTSIRSVLEAMPGPPGNLAVRVSYLQYLPEQITRRYHLPDSRRTLVVGRVQDVGIARHEPVFSRIESRIAALETRHPGYRFRLTGPPVVGGRNVSEVVTDLASSLGMAAAIILVVMGVVYRSVRIGLITIVPNLFPLVVTGAALALTGRALDIASVCAFTICLGIAVDDTIHFMSRFQYELDRDGHVQNAIRRAFLAVGTAMIITTVVLVCGFSVLLTSQMPMHRMFAGMCCSTIGAALAGDLILLPAMLAWFVRPKAPIAMGGEPLEAAVSASAAAP